MWTTTPGLMPPSAAILLGTLLALSPASKQMFGQDPDVSGTKEPARAPAQEPARSGDTSGRPQSEPAEPTLPSLEEMLTIALKNHPDVRAAEARVHATEADLDRTRLDVVQKISAFRNRWQSQKAVLATAQQELHLMEAARLAGKRIAAAKKDVALHRAKLAEIEVELPFLLGRPADRRAAENGSSKQQAELVAISGEILDTTLQSHRTGRIDLDRTYLWSRRLMEARRALGKGKADQIAAIEAHLSLMKDLRSTAEALFRSGEAGKEDILAGTFYVKEAELWLSQVQDE